MRGISRGPQANAGPARGRRKEERASERANACNSPTLPIRTQSPLFAKESPSLSLSLCLSLLLSIYLYSFLIRAACRGLTPFARGPHRRNTRGPVPRMRAPRRASGPPSWQTEDALHLLRSTPFCFVLFSSRNNFCYFCNDGVLRDTHRVSLRYTRKTTFRLLFSVAIKYRLAKNKHKGKHFYAEG